MPYSIGDDGVISVGNNSILFPVDGNFRPSAFLSGFDTNGNITLASFTPAGALICDATFSGSITVGDVGITGVDHTGTPQDIGAVLNPDTTSWALYTQDQRMTFNSGALVVSVTGVDNVTVSNFPAIQAVSQSGLWSTDRTWSLSSGTDSVAVTGTFWQALQPVSAQQSGAWTTGRTWDLASGTDSVSSVQSGAWTTGRTWVINSSTDSIEALQYGTWTVQPGNTPNTTPWLFTISQGGNSASVTGANALKVDGSAVTQPVSGTFWQPTQPVSVADQGVTGDITSAGAAGAVTLPVPNGSGSCEIYISAVGGPFVATLNVQGTVDNLNWSTLLTASGSTALYSNAAFTTTGKYRVLRTASLVGIRVVATTYTSGTIGVVINAAQPVAISEVVQQTAANLLTSSWLSDGVGNALSSTSGALNVSAVIAAQDSYPATQSITTQDTGSTSSSNANGQVWYTGTPTAGSYALFTAPSVSSGQVEVTGTWTGTLQVEVSFDAGTNWIAHSIHQIGSSNFVSNFTQNIIGSLNLAGKTQVRVRATAAMTGTAVVQVNESLNATNIYVANSLKLVDSSVGGPSMNIAAASSPALPTNTAIVTTKAVASTMNNNQVSVTNAATLIIAANTSRKRVVLMNLGTTPVYIGGSSAVTSSNGQLLNGIAGYPLPIWYTGAIYGITASGSQSVSYHEEAI